MSAPALVDAGDAARGGPRVSALRAFSDADLYQFGLWIGLRTLSTAPVEALKSLVCPIEYIRCAESRYVLQHLGLEAGQSVLDIGSPKLPSLFLAARCEVKVDATDLLDYFFLRYGAYAAALPAEARSRYRMGVQDGRHLTYPDGSFDRVFSISAIEHIAGDGDTRAIGEIARVLKPGGLACITVPWGLRGYVEEFHRAGHPEFYWADGVAGEPVFYQRAYDLPSLEARILTDPRLELRDLTFFGERRWCVEHYILSRRLPRLVRWALLPLHFYLSRVFVGAMGEAEPCRKKVGCLTLRRR